MRRRVFGIISGSVPFLRLAVGGYLAAAFLRGVLDGRLEVERAGVVGHLAGGHGIVQRLLRHNPVDFWRTNNQKKKQRERMRPAGSVRQGVHCV